MHKGNYGSVTETVPVASTIEGKAEPQLVSPEAKFRRVKGLLDEVDLNTLILASFVCFLITFGIKATQIAKENSVKTLMVIVGSFVLFGLLIATVFKVILLHKEKNDASKTTQGPCTLC